MSIAVDESFKTKRESVPIEKADIPSEHTKHDRNN